MRKTALLFEMFSWVMHDSFLSMEEAGRRQGQASLVTQNRVCVMGGHAAHPRCLGGSPSMDGHTLKTVTEFGLII